MMAAIGVREEGVGRNRGGQWGMESMHETLCTVADKGLSGPRGAGRCIMYMHGNENLSMLYSKGGIDEDRLIQGMLG